MSVPVPVPTSVPQDLWAFDSEYWGPVGYYMGVLTHPQRYDTAAGPTYTVFETAAAARQFFQDPACPVAHVALASPRADFEAWSDKAAGEAGWYYPAAPQVWNTTAMHWMEDENDSHKLDDTCKKFLGYNMRKPIHMVQGEPWFLHLDGRDTPLWEADQAEVLEYCKIDSSKTRDCVRPIWDRLEPAARKWYWQVEAEIDRIVFEMRARGVAIDIPLLDELTEKCRLEREDKMAELYAMVGYEFNLSSSSPQTGYVLFEHEWEVFERGAVGLYKNGKVKYGQIPTKRRGYGLSGGRRTPKSGKWMTNAETLEALTDDHPVLDALLEYREWDKIYTTYLRGMKRFIDESGRLRGYFNPIGPVTGRFSSSGPNLQNFPKQGVWGKRLRSLFISAPGKMLVVADQAQVEMRITAAFSDCTALIKAFAEGVDIHVTNATLAGLEQDAEGHLVGAGGILRNFTFRDGGKKIGYSLLYGQGPEKLGKALGKNKHQAEDVLNTYFRNVPELDEFMDSKVEMAYRQGYIRTLGGRKRRLPGLYSPRKVDQWRAERQAINAAIQGSAADIVKLWMIECRHLPLILTVHDELVAEVDEKDAEWACQELIDGMARAVARLAPDGIGVDLICEPSAVRKWGDKT